MVTPKFEKVNLLQLLAFAIVRFQSRNILKPDHFEYVIAGNYDYLVEGDSTSIVICINNILDNALEAIEKQGFSNVNPGDKLLTIDVNSVGGNNIISVIDKGIGIDTEVVEKINNGSLLTYNGMRCLSLRITKEIMQAHGGDLLIFKSTLLGTTAQLIFNRLL